MRVTILFTGLLAVYAICLKIFSRKLWVFFFSKCVLHIKTDSLFISVLPSEKLHWTLKLPVQTARCRCPWSYLPSFWVLPESPLCLLTPGAKMDKLFLCGVSTVTFVESVQVLHLQLDSSLAPMVTSRRS